MQNDLTRQKESFNSRAKNYYISRNGDKQLLLRDLLYKEFLKDIVKYAAQYTGGGYIAFKMLRLSRQIKNMIS